MSTHNLQSVLYVDDDPDICEVVRTTLSLIGGLIVHTAGSGEAAIDLAHEHRPDIILMDVMMPGLDGPSTFKRMRGSPLLVNIPVIFLTAKVMPEEICQLLKSGAIGVIGKPFDPPRLCDELFALWKNARIAQPIASASTGRSQVQTQVVALSDSFLARVRTDVGRLREMIERARLGEHSALKEVERVAHSIHGAGAMFGFPKVSATGGAIERLVEGAAAGTGPTSEPRMLKQLLDCTAQLAHELETAVETTSKDIGMFQV